MSKRYSYGPQVVPPMINANAGPAHAKVAVNDSLAEVDYAPNANASQVANKLSQQIRGATGAQPLFTFLVMGLVIAQLIFSILTLQSDHSTITSRDRAKAIVNQVVAWVSFAVIAQTFGFEYQSSSTRLFSLSSLVVIVAAGAALTSTPAPVGFIEGSTPVSSVHGYDIANLVFTSILFGLVIWAWQGSVIKSWF